MAKLEELVVSLVAETQGLRKDLNEATKATKKATDKMGNAVDDFSKESTQGISTFQMAMGTMAGFVGGSIVTGAFDKLKSAATGLFNTFVIDGVAAAQVQEDAINNLNKQLALNGNYSREASQDMQDFARELQKTTKIGDEQTLSMLALAATFGKSNEETKKLTQAAVELSAATGLSLEGSIKNLGKTYAGLTGELGESLPIIRTLTAEQLKNGEALDLIINRFGGTAAAQIQTFSGLQQQLSNSFGDLTEQIGAVVTENQVYLAVMTELNKIINEQTDAVEGNKNAYQQLVGEGLITVIDVIGIMLTSLDQIVRAWQVFTGVINALLIPLGALVAGFKILTGNVEGATKEFNANMELMKKQLNAFAEENRTSLGDAAARFAEMSVAGEKGLAKIRAGLDSTIEPLNATGEKIKEVTELEKQRVDALKQFATALADNQNAIAENYAFELEALKMNLDNKLITENEYMNARQDMLNEKHEAEQARLKQARDENLVTEKQYQSAVSKLNKIQDLETRKLMSERLKFEKQKQAEREANLNSTLGVISRLTQSSNRELAALGKGAAITQATIDGYAAVQKALASAPPPFNFALAAAVGAATLQNISRIRGVSLNRGGEVPGLRGANRDSVPAMLTPGETVIDRSTTDALKEFLKNQMNDQRITIELALRDNLIDFIEERIIERQSTGTSLIQTRLT